VLICGGYGPGGVYYSSADIYDPTTGSWRPTGAMTTTRKNHAATRLANGNVLVTGGYHDPCTVLSSAELYNSNGLTLNPVLLTNTAKLKTGALQFTFNSSPGALWRVLATTNPALPLDQWSPQGVPVEMPPGRFQFTDPNTTNLPVRFYRTVSIP
jgi:hypothetical protein